MSAKRRAFPLPKRTRTRGKAPRSLQNATRRLVNALERAESQRLNLTLTASTLGHHVASDALQDAAELIGALIAEALELVREASTTGGLSS